MAYDMRELAPLLARKAAKYSGCDSTSMPYEKARRLMAGIIYCIDAYRDGSGEKALCRPLPLARQYALGAQKVRGKVEHIREVYNRMAPGFKDYGVLCLKETVQEGIPAFLRRYDVQFFPQETILTLDYPLLWDVHQLCGAEAVDAFISAVEIEQRFLGAYDEDDVAALLGRSNAGWREMVENICEPVLLNALGRWILQKPASDRGFQPGEYQDLYAAFEGLSISALQEVVTEGIAAIAAAHCPKDTDAAAYLLGDARNLAVRIGNTARHRRFDRIFLL